jgi:hypothetical protein
MHFCKPESEEKDPALKFWLKDREMKRAFLKQDIEDYCGNPFSHLTDGKRGELKRRARELGVDFRCPGCGDDL